MYKSMTVEEIKQRPEIESLGNLNTLTMFYDPAADEIILNSSNKYYDICQALVERYLSADEDHREKYKNAGANHFAEETTLLDKVIEIRKEIKVSYQEKLRKRYAKELKMIGENNSYWDLEGVLEAIDITSSPYFKTSEAFTWGYIQGKRAERARRKKVTL
ncbi:hypothetical protein [Anaerocolumna jejuensis]|uniref:hypothetical protein n=1 Tax=Anaerocolumna jejuensis TaxID=259063 RepID=UPI003F7C05D6